MVIMNRNTTNISYGRNLASNETKQDGAVAFWSALFLVEGLLSTLLNFLTLLTFAVNAHLRRRSVYLILGLSLADMLVGVSAVIYAGAMLESGIVYQYASLYSEFVPAEIADIFFASLSLNCLVLISLERMYATVAPFKHRNTMTFRVYVGAFISPWMLGVAAICFYLLSRFYFFYVSAALTFLSLLLICAFYIAIFISVKHQHSQQQPAVQGHVHITRRRERELAKTLFIVTVLSLLTWLPNAVWTAQGGSDVTLDKIAYSFRFVNSLINPVVYLFRMKDFRAALLKLLRTCASSEQSEGLPIVPQHRTGNSSSNTSSGAPPQLQFSSTKETAHRDLIMSRVNVLSAEDLEENYETNSWTVIHECSADVSTKF